MAWVSYKNKQAYINDLDANHFKMDFFSKQVKETLKGKKRFRGLTECWRVLFSNNPKAFDL